MNKNLKTPLTFAPEDNLCGSSFFDSEIKASVNELKKILGEPDDASNDGFDKVNFEWGRKLDDGTLFSVYDWKEYRELDLDEPIMWHIGGFSVDQTRKVQMVLLNALNS